MKDYSDALKALFVNSGAARFVLVKIGPNLTPITLYYTSLAYDHDYEGDTYMTNNSLLSVEAPSISSVIGSESYSLVFGADDYSMRPYFDSNNASNMIGRDIKVVGGFVNISKETINGVLPGAVFSEYFLLYEGFVDGGIYDINPREQIIVNVGAVSPMGVLENTNVSLTDKRDLRAVHQDDTSFDELFEGSSEVELKWGVAR